MDQESDRFLSVAGAVIEGDAISWEDAKSLEDNEASAATLRGLQELEKIVAAQRAIRREYDTTTGREGAAKKATARPSRWRHLLILDKIGEGSFGAVYRAYDDQLALDVALKLIPRATAHAKSPERILSEAQLLARVRHPNVVTVYGVDQADGYVGVWMEFIKGRTLGELLKTQGPFAASDVAVIGRDLCHAVAAVHHAGVLHGDIKAHNVMRQDNGRTVLMDFGAGRRLVDDRSPEAMRSVAGTPLYLAPEVLEGRAPTIASDIYSLGVLLYHLVTGSYPVRGNTVAEITQAHRRGERGRLREAYPDLPENFVRVVEEATAVDPVQRFATAAAFEQALARVTPEHPSATGRSDDKPPFIQIPRQLMVLAVLVLIAAVAATVWLARPGSSMRPFAPAASTPPASTTSPVTGSPASGEYEIDAGFYRAGPNGDEKLSLGGRVKPGDELFLKFQASVPVNLYVVNEDELGNSLLLFPLPGSQNVIQPSREVTLPERAHWQIDKAGGHEHFLVFASPERMDAFAQVFASLPSPRENQPVVTARKLDPEQTIARLRSVGGLVPERSAQATAKGLSQLFTNPLTNARESVRGLWIRQITLDNPLH